MIIDAHCHAWRAWPYDPDVPDIASRGSIDNLRYEMDRHGVDRAVLVAARIGTEHPRTDNADNNAYCARAVAERPDRFSLFADVDSFWGDDHHTDGAAQRLESIIAETSAEGFTHYSTGEVDGWFDSPAGLEFFGRASELGLIASLHTPPAWLPALATLAGTFSDLTILVHHQGHAASDDEFALLLAAAEAPNLWLKMSGFHYLVDDQTEYPFPTRTPRIRQIVEAYGPERMVWGSDWPVAGDFLSYPQTLDVWRRHCDLTAGELELIMGGNMARLLAP